MQQTNITKSILSISSPGTYLEPSNPALGRRLTRECNAYAAALKRAYPEKFGFWASLPVPDVEGCLEEIERAAGEGADGFVVLTNAGGVYLGEKGLEAVWGELERRGAVVFVHPTRPCMRGCRDREGEEKEKSTCSAEPQQSESESKSKSKAPVPVPPVPATPLAHHYRIPMFEFLFDTARAVLHLFLSGTVQKYPHVTYIIPHAGGAMPPLWTRFIEYAHYVPSDASAPGGAIDQKLARKALHERFYFDLAGWVFDGEEGGQGQLKGLVEGLGVRAERLLYGSDYPFTKGEFVRGLAERMGGGLEALFQREEERKGVYEGNARALLGREMVKE